MIFYLFANCFSALSGVVNKYFIKNGYYDPNVQMLDVTFHANIYNVIFYFTLYFYFYRKNEIAFSIKNTFFQKQQIWQVLLFAIPIYASAYKILMFQKMPISYVEISSMIKPFCVFFLALFLLKEKFYPSFLIYIFIAISGFLLSNFDKIYNSGFNGTNSDLFKIIYFIAIASIGDITRRYYCKKWDNAMHSICVEVVVFAFYGLLWLSISNRFSLNTLLNPCTLLYAIITFSHHICVILGVQRAKSVSALEIVNFSKLVFSLVFCYLILGEEQTYKRIFGALIILTSILIFNFHRKILNKNNKFNKNGNNDKKDCQQNNIH